jgi:hypothetical protein
MRRLNKYIQFGHSSMRPRIVAFFKTAVCVLLVCAQDPSWCQTRTAHNIVKGTAVDAENGLPLPSATVFVHGTTRGTSTNNDGTFLLLDLPGGEFDLVFSLVGYESEKRHLSLRDSVRLEVNVKLKPRTISVPGIEVTASAEEWKRLLPMFSREFVGITENATKCRMCNPEVVSLSIGRTGDSLLARTDSTLVVENDALGYRMYVRIEDFFFIAKKGWFETTYYVRYEEMQPKNEDQALGWQNQRGKTYDYSFTHFLKSIIDHRVQEAKFIVSSGDLSDLQRGRADELEAKNIIVYPVRDSSTFRIDFPSEYIRVDRSDQFGSWKVSMQNTWYYPSTQAVSVVNQKAITSSIVRLKLRPILVDFYGNLVNLHSVAFRAYWAICRLGDTLPFDYQPEKEKE